ncbi:biotin/lipoyl-binding protein (plasmid) [Rhodobacteraceae bacterium M382]|nr:biotin/lipoyl-binding protein [Rhodobacteraceae bacterium M382]
MIELILTSFPLVIRIMYLRWRGIPVTLYNVHRAVFLWFVIAVALFFTVFYYYPKSYTGLVPFRIVPVVAENGGTVTQVLVKPGDHVATGDLLFTVENTSEQAAVDVAEHQVVELQNAIEAGEVEVRTAQAVLKGAEAGLAQIELSLADQTALKDRNSAAFRENEFERAQNTRLARLSEVEAARTQLESASLKVTSVLPAQLETAESMLEQAQAELAKTRVYAVVDGTVEQLTLNVGARAGQTALSAAMVIVPDDRADPTSEVAAGFSQVASAVLYEGMAAEIACDSNFNASMRNTVLPARLVRLQEVIAAGQIKPTGYLMETSERAQRGEIVAHFKLVHPEHTELLIDGSGCMVQAYTTHVTGPLEGSVLAHVIEALGALKAILLRIKVWVALASGIGLTGGGH